MKKIEGQSWKDYYASERYSRNVEICHTLAELWDRDDPEVTEVLRKGGALSVPHTMLETSMDPLIRTVKAVHKAGKRKVLAVGLVHNKEGISMGEFCLDGIRYFLEMASDTLALPSVKIEDFFAERDMSVAVDDIEHIVKNMGSVGRKIKRIMDPDTALIMTGDLAHYGYGYNMTEVVEDPGDLIRSNVVKALDLLYRKNDPIEWLKFSRAIKNDQVFVGLAVNEALGKGLDYRIFSSEISDYSTVLSAKKPTVVASVFYGVSRKT